MKQIHWSIIEHLEVIQNIEIKQIKEIGKVMSKAAKKGKTIFFIGCGGSAADAQHLAAELISKFKIENRKSIPAIALTTNTSIMSAISNDYEFKHVFERQIEGLVKKGDVVVGISTSGNSKSIIDGIIEARINGAVTIGFTGKTGGKLQYHCDHMLNIPSEDTARIQEGHILVGHILCGIIEEAVK